MRYIKYCLLILIFFTLSISQASNQLLHYEPAVVELHGVLDIKTFPGPPNYEDIKKGDVSETSYYLKLSQPIDVAYSLMSNMKQMSSMILKRILALSS